GQTVPVQTLVAVIETDKSAPVPVAAPPAPAPPKAAPPPAAASPVVPRPTPASPVAAPKGDGGETAEERLRKRPTPLVRKLAAQVTTFFEVDYTRVAELRRKHKAAYAERGVNLTYLAFITKACAENLRKHPVVNAAVSGDNIIYRAEVNIGIAVALDWGLIVPVVKHADELSLVGIARAINDLGERARTKKLSPDEIQRGTFTITNPGVFGSY